QIAQHPDEPLQVTVLRSGATANEKSANETPQDITFIVPTHPLRTFGLVMEMGPITGIQAGSLAAEAGLKVGDVIEAINGQPIDGSGEWDAFTIPQRMLQAAQAGQQLTLSIRRPDAASPAESERRSTEQPGSSEQLE